MLHRDTVMRMSHVLTHVHAHLTGANSSMSRALLHRRLNGESLSGREVQGRAATAPNDDGGDHLLAFRRNLGARLLLRQVVEQVSRSYLNAEPSPTEEMPRERNFTLRSA